MANYRLIRFYICSVVCHGESEVLLIEHLRKNYRIPIETLSEKNGRRSININTINSYLEAHFPSVDDYIKCFDDCINHEKRRLINHKIFAVMDKDDTSDEIYDKYKDKTLFKSHWWGKDDYIVPIYFYPNMDYVFRKHGFEINTSRDKPQQYFKLLSTKSDEIIGMLKSLPKSESNIKELLDYIEYFQKKYNSKLINGDKR